MGHVLVPSCSITSSNQPSNSLQPPALAQNKLVFYRASFAEPEINKQNQLGEGI